MTKRIRCDMIQVRKILNKKDRVDKSTFFVRLSENSTRATRATSSGLNLITPRSNLEIRKNFFSCRVPKLWNELPENIKVATSVETFKLRYDKWKRVSR